MGPEESGRDFVRSGAWPAGRAEPQESTVDPIVRGLTQHGVP